MQYQSLQGFYKVCTLIGEGGGVRSGLVDQFQIICLINGMVFSIVVLGFDLSCSVSVCPNTGLFAYLIFGLLKYN